MPNRSKEKGTRFEYEVRDIARAAGHTADRVPLSGAAGGEFESDLIINGERYECKVRRTGFGQIYKWLGRNIGLFIKADRSEPLIVLRARDFFNRISCKKKV